MERFLFFGFVALGAIWLLLRRRRFDFFTVGYCASVVYFLPAFFGVVADVNLAGPITLAQQEILSETYGVMALLVALVVFGAMAFDLLTDETRGEARGREPFDFELRGALDSAAVFAVAIGLAGFLLTAAEAGSNLLHREKAVVLESLGRAYILWSIGAVVAAVLSVLSRRWWCFALAAALLLVDVFIGFRSNAAMASIGVATLVFARRPPFALGRSVRLAAVGLGVAAVFFLYKGVYMVVKVGAWDLAFERISDAQFLEEVVLYSSEPFLTCGTLNEVVRSEFTIPSGHYLDLVYALVPFASELGVRVTSFNEYFQPSLFPDREAGLASSFLAEAWSVARWFSVALVSVLYVAGLWIGSRLLQSPRAMWRALAAALFPFWAFYIHRNDILYQFVLQRRVLIVFLVAVLLSAIWYEAQRALRTRREESVRVLVP